MWKTIVLYFIKKKKKKRKKKKTSNPPHPPPLLFFLKGVKGGKRKEGEKKNPGALRPRHTLLSVGAARTAKFHYKDLS